MIISRDLINKKIVYTDLSVTYSTLPKYGYDHLSKLIDTYKNLLITKGAKKGQSVVIGNQANISQIALVFACAELGLTIVISSHPLNPTSNIKQYNRVQTKNKLKSSLPFRDVTKTKKNKGSYLDQISNKLKLMLPIDFFILSDEDQTDKYHVFNDVCNTTINISQEVLDSTPNDIIWADKDSVLIKCTSSGTTDTPKVITHTHEFLGKLIVRNSKQFYGTMGMLSNLAHGSSPAVYFLPGLVSDSVTDYINFCDSVRILEVVKQLAKTLADYNLSLDHLLIPYTEYINNFFESDNNLPNCILYTLSIIRNEWLEPYSKGSIKDIVSIFGTNETSGPFFTNQISHDNFSSHHYKMVDDFYTIEITDKNNLIVTVPVYNKKVETGDLFLYHNTRFEHLGRNNLYRINDLDFDLEKYNSTVKKFINAQIVLDTKKESIYLAIWDETADEKQVAQINTIMKMNSKGLHYISKYGYLTYDHFLSGVKLDMEMLREYFRKL